MNDLQKAYLDGASMAYKDVAQKIRDMITNAPSRIKDVIGVMEPLAVSCDLKSQEVYKEAERIENSTKH